MSIGTPLMGATSTRDSSPLHAGILMCVFTAVAYHNVFGGVFLFDDHSGIVRNRTIRSIESALFSDWEAIPTAYQRRPVVNWSYAVNYAVSGLDPWSYHVFNVLIHIGCMLLLFDFLRRTLQLESVPEDLRNNAVVLAGTIALLWGTHPLQTQSVTYTTQRCESLMSFCYLLCLYGVLQSSSSARKARWYCLVIASFVVGMATKEVMVTAPILVMIYDRIFLSASWRKLFRERRFLYGGFSIGILWLASALLRTSFDKMGREIASGRHATGWEYLLTQPEVLLRYLRLSFWPSGFGVPPSN